MKSGAYQIQVGNMRGRDVALVNVRSPLGPMDGLVETPSLEYRWIGQVGEVRCPQLELSDQRGVLNKSLVVLSPGRRQFPRRIDGWNTHWVPTTTEARRPLP